MQKKLLTKLFSLSAILLTACNSNTALNYQYTGLDQLNNTQISARTKNSDWYSSLKPELQQYYAPARGKTGEDLFEALHKIISQGNRISSYQDSKSYMYAVVDNIESRNGTGILTAYSQVFIPGSGGNGGRYTEQGDPNKDGVSNDFINCEHTWPQSFFNKSLPMVADIHHLQSTLSVPNNRRGHYPFGEAKGTIVYSTSSGSKLSLNDSKRGMSASQLRSIYQEKGTSADFQSMGLDAVFEPTDKDKGNTARALLYFNLRYYDQNIRSGEYEKRAFWDSNVKDYIRWSSVVDPVDANERRRNDLVQQKQGNRNPFIDVPAFAELIGENVFLKK